MNNPPNLFGTNPPSNLFGTNLPPNLFGTNPPSTNSLFGRPSTSVFSMVPQSSCAFFSNGNSLALSTMPASTGNPVLDDFFRTVHVYVKREDEHASADEGVR